MTIDQPINKLTPREQQVVELAGQRLCDKEIAQALGLSPRTVQNHLHRAYEKLGVSDRLQAAKRLSDYHSGQSQPLLHDVTKAADDADLLTEHTGLTTKPAETGLKSFLRGWQKPPRLGGSLLWLILGWALIWLVVSVVGAALANMVLEAVYRLQAR